MCNVIESSKGKEPAATPGRSQTPFQGVRLLITLRSIESRQHSYARKLARRLPALYLATLGQLNRAREIILSPTHPPLAPARTRPIACARVVPGQTLAAPRPARGGRGKQNQAAREIARGHQAPLRFSALRLQPARSLRSAR